MISQELHSDCERDAYVELTPMSVIGVSLYMDRVG